MRYLRIGSRVLPVHDEVANSWPAVAEQALRDMDRLNLLHATVSYRTDTGAVGSLPLTPAFPVSFEDTGEATHPELGAIVQISADPDIIAEAARARQQARPDLTDEQIQDLVHELQQHRPDVAWSSKLSGRLAGPATPDRPDLPPWNYLNHLTLHPETRLEDLTAIRFPVRHHDGSLGVTSIDEQLLEHVSPTTPRRCDGIGAAAIVALYQALHNAGVLGWDEELRGVVQRQGLTAHRTVLHAWARTLHSK